MYGCILHNGDCIGCDECRSDTEKHDTNVAICEICGREIWLPTEDVYCSEGTYDCICEECCLNRNRVRKAGAAKKAAGA